MGGEIEARISGEKAPIDFLRHAEEVRELNEAYARRENRRVPVVFLTDEQVWTKQSGVGFQEFYADPAAHLRVQLEGNLWFANNVIGDMPPGPPDVWDVRTIAWMEENEFFGCEVVYQRDDYAWAKPLPLGKKDLLRHIADIDPDDRVRRNSAYPLYLGIRDLAEDKTFMGRPVRVSLPGQGTQGIFTKAAEIRGLERLCMDLYDDPDWAAEYLSLIAEKSIARSIAWHRLIYGKEPELPSPNGYLACDDSLQMISAALYEKFVLECHERYFSAFTKGWRGIHLCGFSTQHYKVLHDRLGITVLDGPGVFADHARYLDEMPDLRFETARFDGSVLGMGSGRDLEEMTRKLLHPGTKLPGRFKLLGGVNRMTNLGNIRLCYELVKKWGVIGTP